MKVAYKDKFIESQKKVKELIDQISNLDEFLRNKDIALSDKQKIIERLIRERDEFKEKYEKELGRQEVVGENIREECQEQIEEIKKKVKELDTQLLEKNFLIKYLESKADEEHIRRVIKVIAAENEAGANKPVLQNY